ncbi:response regulator [Spirosoma luteum]|uniref:response regulator n=1 Tax=Spirosoma luteum TaxID=431553 RepID=UPI00037D77F5|nr:response regulator [Spirosoma luteum]
MTATPLICVVDDDADYRYLIQLLIKKSLPECDTQLFANGRVFLDELSKIGRLPNVITLDYHMPGMDGLTTLIYLKEKPGYQAIPVVILSAETSRPEIDKCYAVGAESFLDKMKDFQSIGNKITDLVASAVCANQAQASINSAKHNHKSGAKKTGRGNHPPDPIKNEQ